MTHYHFTGWEDWQLPAGKSIKDLDTLITGVGAKYVRGNAHKEGKERKRLLIHCRAGIGRTGTTISLINATLCIEQNKKRNEDQAISVFSIVRRLREQRIWMVQTEE